VLILTAATMMKAYVDMDRVAEFDPECVAIGSGPSALCLPICACIARMGRAGLIKSIMTQAILYGSHSEVRMCSSNSDPLLFMIRRGW
jgi:nuclear pore complex protein Nup133